MRLEIREDQINALTQFSSVTGVYSNYKTGLLLNIYEKEFNPEDPDIQRYIAHYENYLEALSVNDADKMQECLAFLMEIERDYLGDIMIRLRRAICERFYGLRKAD